MLSGRSRLGLEKSNLGKGLSQVGIPVAVFDALPTDIRDQLVQLGAFTYATEDLQRRPPTDQLLKAEALMLPWDLAAAPNEALRRLPRLRMIAVPGTGVSEYDVDGLTAQGVAIGNVRNYASQAVAEHTIALMLACLKEIAQSDQLVRAGGWKTGKAMTEVYGLTLGIIGFGSIGSSVARIANCLGMHVLAFSRSPERVTAAPQVAEFAPLGELLPAADVVSLHASYRPTDSPILDRAQIAHMKRGAVLINTARAGLVDTSALIDALEAGQIRSAGLDVFDHEPILANDRLLHAPNLVLSPHHASNTPKSTERLLHEMALNVIAFLSGRPRNIVNLDGLER